MLSTMKMLREIGDNIQDVLFKTTPTLGRTVLHAAVSSQLSSLFITHWVCAREYLLMQTTHTPVPQHRTTFLCDLPAGYIYNKAVLHNCTAWLTGSGKRHMDTNCRNEELLKLATLWVRTGEEAISKRDKLARPWTWKLSGWGGVGWDGMGGGLEKKSWEK